MLREFKRRDGINREGTKARNVFLCLRAFVVNSVSLAKVFVFSILVAAPAPAPAAKTDAQQTAVAVIVNKSNATESLTLGELREYFLAERSHWPTRQKVRVAMGAAGRPERQLFLRTVCDMRREQDFQAYYLRAKFSEQTLEQPREFSSTPDVLRFVSNVNGAIGFVRADEVDPSVKVVRVENLTPGDPGYKLRQ